MRKSRIIIILFALVGLVILFFVNDPKTGGDILIGFATIFSALFSLLYGFTSNWRSTDAGRSLMYVSSAFAMLGVYITTALWLPRDYPGHDLLRLLMYWIIAVSMLHRLLVWVEVQRAYQDTDEHDTVPVASDGADSR